MAKQKTYSPEFRDYVTKLVVHDGRKQTDISRELDIPYDTLSKWVNRYRKMERDAELARQNHLLSASEYREMYEAERIKRLEMEEEIAILKKAMHIFTQEK
jgi:transposase